MDRAAVSFLALSFRYISLQRDLRHTSRVNQKAIGSKSQDREVVVDLLSLSTFWQFLVGFGEVSPRLDADLDRHSRTEAGLFIDVLDTGSQPNTLSGLT